MKQFLQGEKIQIRFGLPEDKTPVISLKANKSGILCILETHKILSLQCPHDCNLLKTNCYLTNDSRRIFWQCISLR
jgi:hypothetical protein